MAAAADLPQPLRRRGDRAAGAGAGLVLRATVRRRRRNALWPSAFACCVVQHWAAGGILGGPDMQSYEVTTGWDADPGHQGVFNTILRFPEAVAQTCLRFAERQAHAPESAARPKSAPATLACSSGAFALQHAPSYFSPAPHGQA